MTADGKYAGTEKLLMIGTNADPGKKSAEVAANQFEKLGFKLNFRIVTQDALYTKFCGVPKAKVAICPNVGFFKDFVDPESFINPTFNGEAILPANNTNWPQLDDKAINAAIDKAALLPPGTERSKAFAKIDNDITAARAGGAVAVGQDPADRVQGRPGRRGQLLDGVAPVLHLAEVSP